MANKRQIILFVAQLKRAIQDGKFTQLELDNIYTELHDLLGKVYGGDFNGKR